MSTVMPGVNFARQSEFQMGLVYRAKMAPMQKYHCPKERIGFQQDQIKTDWNSGSQLRMT